jgi:hypothetical protein
MRELKFTKPWWSLALILGLTGALVAAPAAMAQSTRGTIEGAVTDSTGAPLPGVTVTLTSPAMPGSQLAVSDARGAFRFLSLPPGSYKAVFDLEGFQQIEQIDIRVGIGQNVRLEVELPESYSEELVVTSERPVVDTASTELGLNLSSDIFQDIATPREAWSVARVAPGAQSDACNTATDPQCIGTGFYGSTAAENSYYIDGVNTTGIEFSQEGKSLNFEFIQEVQVKTAGYTAEYGRAIGGLINVITKSGGNDFQGDVFAYYDDIQNSLSGEARDGPVAGTLHVKEFTRSDYGVDLGGPIARDRLWFFAAYNKVDNEDDVEAIQDFSIVRGPAQGDIIVREEDRDLWAGKLTLQAAAGHSLAFSAFGDPQDLAGLVPNSSLAGTALHYFGTVESGGTDFSASYDGVLSDRVVVNARYGAHEETAIQAGPGKAVPGYLDLTDPLGDGTTVFGFTDVDGTFYESGFTFWQDNDPLEREQWNADISLFVDDFGGSHEWKAGYEFEDITGNTGRFNGGAGQRIYRFDCFDSDTRDCQGSPYYYRHRFFTATNELDPAELVASDVQAPLITGVKTENDAIYLQDTWRPASNVTLNLGWRLETQQLFNRDGEVSGDIDDNSSPRLGLIWDPTKQGKSKVFAHWGRFYETIPMDIVIRSFGGEISIFAYNISPSPDVVFNDFSVRPSRFLGGGISRVDPNTEGQYLDEFVVGGELEVRKGLNVGVKYISRELKNVLEDALAADGDYFIGNPGKGLMEGTFDMGHAFGYNDTLHPLPVPTREFTGVEVTVTKRMTKNFLFLASALWSELEGSYDGSFQLSTGQLDPNLNSAFDYFDFSVNNDGLLSNDREWQFKFDGIYQFDFGMTAGLSAWYRTGTPITAMGYSIGYNNWEFYLSERGAFGRVDDAYEADLHLGYPIKVGDRMEWNLLLDVFNLLDVQTETLRNNRYTIADEGPPLGGGQGYNPIDYETGETFVIRPGDLDKPPTNAAFNTARLWTNPRRIRLGLRLSF